MCVCVCVCVCERERECVCEREREREIVSVCVCVCVSRESIIYYNLKISQAYRYNKTAHILVIYYTSPVGFIKMHIPASVQSPDLASQYSSVKHAAV